MAKVLGKRLLDGVGEEGLSELLSSVRALRTSGPSTYFGIRELDALLPASEPAPGHEHQHQHQSSEQNDLGPWDPAYRQINALPQPKKEPEKKQTSPPILELTSPAQTPCSGKTSLLYLLTTLAILPYTFLSVPLNGKDSAIVILDPLSHFSIHRLAQVTTAYILGKLREAGRNLVASANEEADEVIIEDVKVCVKRALQHVHVLRPQSWDALLTQLSSLPTYLFDSTAHGSTHRAIHAIVLEDMDSFQHAVRSAGESSASGSSSSTPLSTAYTTLTATLNRLSTSLHCAIVITSHASSPTHRYRSVLPASWPTVRLSVRRVEVTRFPPLISVLDAEAQRQQRWDVIKKGRFEVAKVPMAVGAREGEAFMFRVLDTGVHIEKDEV